MSKLIIRNFAKVAALFAVVVVPWVIWLEGAALVEQCLGRTASVVYAVAFPLACLAIYWTLCDWADQP